MVDRSYDLLYDEHAHKYKLPINDLLELATWKEDGVKSWFASHLRFLGLRSCSGSDSAYGLSNAQPLRYSMLSGFLNQRRHFLGMRLVNGVAGSLHLYLVAVRALGVHAFQVGVDGFVVLCH